MPETKAAIDMSALGDVAEKAFLSYLQKHPEVIEALIGLIAKRLVSALETALEPKP